MMKKIFSMSVAVVLAVILTVSSPLQAFAASKPLYISSIRMSDSIEKLEALGYKVLDKDLNAGTTESDVYIGFQTTNNPKEAITDISIMDMKGGYSFGDYEEMLKRQKSTYAECGEIQMELIAEFRQRYQEGSPAAKKAYQALNNYVEDDSGMLLGDLFLDTSLTLDALIRLCTQISAVALNTINEALTIGVSDFERENWMKRLSEKGPDAQTDDYYDAASRMMNVMTEFRRNLIFIDDALKDDEEQIAQDHPVYALVHMILETYSYGSGTLLDFFMSDFSLEELYPMIDVLSEGQRSAVMLGSITALIYSPNADAAAWDEAERTLQENNSETATKPDEPISIYTGIDRSLFTGGVALTSAAKREMSATGDTSALYGNLNGGEIAIFFAAGCVFLMGAAIVAISKLMVATGTYSAFMFLRVSAVNLVGMKASIEGISGIWLGRTFVTFYGAALLACVAIIMILAVLYISLELKNYYNPTYTEIPKIMLDLKFGEDEDAIEWEQYIRYDVVLDEDGDKGDLNDFEGKQWNAMYTTKDRAAGNPITADSFLVQYGDSTTPRGYEPVHYFGDADAFDLNSHCYDNKVGGVFVFFQRDVNAFSTGTASVFDSGAIAAVTGISGLIIGTLGTLLFFKRKKVSVTEA